MGSQLSDDTWRLGHQPALQGVRALAVLAVSAYHVGQLSGGWLGVEAFFVLSGFLITCLLLGEAGDGRSIGRFYLRRAARLLPALVVVVVAVLAYVALRDPAVTGLSVDAHQRGAVGALLLHHNWLGISGADAGLYGHIWSLSIEEQFYLAWPLLLAVCARLGGARLVAVVAAVGFVATATLRAVLADGDGLWLYRVYLGTDTRGAGLLLGCAVGALMVHTGGRLGRNLPWPWVIALLTPPLAWAVIFTRQWDTRSWDLVITAFDLAVVAIIVGLVDRRTWASGALSLPPVAYLGALSYSLYLWQYPVSRVAALELDGPARPVAMLVVPLLLAMASYHLLEQPVRRRVRARASRTSAPEPSPAPA